MIMRYEDMIILGQSAELRLGCRDSYQVTDKTWVYVCAENDHHKHLWRAVYCGMRKYSPRP